MNTLDLPARSPRRPTGFTLVEMLVVVVLIVLLVLIALPAFSSMLANQSRTSSASLLQQGLAQARDAALRSGSGDDAAAVFTMEPGGAMTIITAVRVGTLNDLDRRDPNNPQPQLARRDVFAPLPTADPIALPANWTVRARVPGFFFDDAWYEPNALDAEYDRYPAGPFGHPDYWILPETGFYDHTKRDAGNARQTFMVRFAGGTGRLMYGPSDASIVLLPRTSSIDPVTGAADQWQNATDASDLRRWAQRVLKINNLTSPNSSYGLGGNNPSDGTGWNNPDDALRRGLIGSGANGDTQSSDVVLAKPAWFVALCDERKLASALGVSVDRYSGTVFTLGPGAANDYANNLSLKTLRWPELSGRTNDAIAQAVGRFIEGYDKIWENNGTVPAAASEARVFTIDRFSGDLRDVRKPGQPLAPLGGVQ